MRTAAPDRLGGILVVDDDAELAKTLQEFLEQEGYAAEVALSAPEALLALERNPHLSLALVDLIMPVTDGLALMEQLHRRNPDMPVLVMTGYGTIETAVEAIKRGAEDYLTKPFDYHAVRKKIARLMEVFELRERVEQLEANLDIHPSFESFVYVSPMMQKVVDRARAVGTTDASVLVLGETGTGKELLARAIHAAGPRARKPFIPINCGALPRELVESELFGFRRGAFTGAYADAPGIFASASGGTVFLDEIGEMPREVQVKLLRVLQEGELRPVGGAKLVQVDVRVISATNRPLAELRSACLREDLYYRIATVTIELPPLRSRMEDVLVLAQHFTTRLARRYGRKITLARSALELLLNYSFPGNVRELENILEGCAAVIPDDPQVIADKDVKPLLSQPVPIVSALSDQSLSMEELERLAVQRALRVSQGNRTKAASLLGISRDTLYRKLKQFGL
ncbi:MAG: sigma-54 dependent transcriptional regulator [Bryobacterales bacterium]|nr:sigma-54 dependent transcriptional regulator [Bryobacterales bacterium]